MPQLIKKFIKYVNHENKIFIKGVWEYPEPVLYRYAFKETTKTMSFPAGAKIDFDASLWEKFQLFDTNNEFRISEDMGQYGIIYLQLEPGKYLESIYVEPDAVAVDLFHSEDALVYEFYNPSKIDTMTIRAKQAIDTDGIFQKIKSHKDDLEFRQYILRQALIKTGISKIDRPKTEYPEYVSVKQAAELLNTTENAIRIRAHRGQLIKHKIGGALRFKTSEILE